MTLLLNAVLPTEGTVGLIRLDALPLSVAKDFQLAANSLPIS
jgi:hypothetical protein